MQTPILPAGVNFTYPHPDRVGDPNYGPIPEGGSSKVQPIQMKERAVAASEVEGF